MKIKLTKGELKKQRDSLRQYERYLPTLQLKKQQLQLEILHQINLLEEKKKDLLNREKSAELWAGLLGEEGINLKPWVLSGKASLDVKNVAGTDVPVFLKMEFPLAEYDLFSLPLWVDRGIDFLREVFSLEEQLKIIEEGVRVLRKELRVTTQRVNLFEKVKIPETKEAIRLIKIYIGDQMANAVGRSKIAKNKIEESLLEEVLA